MKMVHRRINSATYSPIFFERLCWVEAMRIRGKISRLRFCTNEIRSTWRELANIGFRAYRRRHACRSLKGSRHISGQGEKKAYDNVVQLILFLNKKEAYYE